MEIYVGGSWQGKTAYVQQKKKLSAADIFDGKNFVLSDIEEYPVVNQVHEIVKRLLEEDRQVLPFFEDLYEKRRDIILICDEVGSGVVPLDKKDRIYREQVGRLMCEMAKKADVLERVVCGVGMRVKG